VEALGPVLLVASIPMMLGWIPPNRFYGFRIPATLGSKAVWYAVNARFGRHIFVLGLAMVLLEFVLPIAMRVPVLSAIGTAGLFVIVVADWRTANRWRRERDVPQVRVR
jgi:SdpI/YhfL family protein